MSRSAALERMFDQGRQASNGIRDELAELDTGALRAVYEEAAGIRIGDVDYGAWLVHRTIKALAGLELDARRAKRPGEVSAE